ncbi:MAG: type II toxin-antitoxin system VapC family toxin [Syntrophaceae bacterium]|nr:type II toxin-antitoxin system VapC family toxin [Syntrophaceae bacterium]
MIGIIDTSAVIRLFIDDGPITEGLEKFLREVERGNAIALAPELMLVEAANVLYKKMLRDELTSEEAKSLLDEITRLPIRREGHDQILQRSFAIAENTNLTVYDSLFLSLAEYRSGVLFTGDNKLLQAAKGMGLAP